MIRTGRAVMVRLVLLVVLAAAILVGVSLWPVHNVKSQSADSAGPRILPPPSTTSSTPDLPADTAPGRFCPCPNLTPGSNPAVLPGPMLIADHMNNRLMIVEPNGTVAWIFPGPHDLPAGQTFLVPDDAFFTPDGRNIVATEEDNFVIRLINVAQRRIVWTYGTPGQPGSAPGQLWNPDDAMMQPNGQIISADIKNCRLLLLEPGLAEPLKIFGTTTNQCWHDPPLHWGSPNGAFPMANGDYLVTEINGDWVDEMTAAGQIRFSAHPPGVDYPSDTNEVRPGVYLTADYSDPGQVEEFDATGRLLWRFKPGGAAALNQPSLALPLPNGDVLCNDDYNHRVIVIDPRTNRIVWQYGHTGRAGAAPGYLNVPDGIDLLPPYSLTITHAATMGR